ncbi:DmsC/YnfH family molybdoenzyme membrane anchor subunit [Salmonella enterica]|uniref:DmsC/YnfH family molybdoenzyme membrane anchor subunit n=1 Tax=Salmonella enterica TaxID=28901 RepID=UPI0005DC5EBF|nr:DmsC/YnfH family molybdoenzyme membrane anchor subunit [Salmonella enterica]CNO40350.1 dmso reductase anchor subunit [Salmonella enterica subsp. enterica serovar Typhimurium str. DT104]
MGSGWHEWPLMIFTVFGQCVVGALIVSGLGWLTAKDDTIARQRIVRSMFFLWLVMGLGFLASIMHLGSPMRAFNSLNRVIKHQLEEDKMGEQLSIPYPGSPFTGRK